MSTHKSKKSHKSGGSGRTRGAGDDQQWSEPINDPTNGRWYIYRQNPTTGDYDYHWYELGWSPSDDSIPRTGLEDITQGVEDMSMDQRVQYSTYPQEQQGAYPDPAVDGSEYYTTEQPREHRSGKGKHKAREAVSSYHAEPSSGGQDQTGSTGGHREGKGKAKARNDHVDTSGGDVDLGQGYGDQPLAYDPAYAEVVQQSTQEAYGAATSADLDQYADPSAYGSTSTYRDPYTAQDSAYLPTQGEVPSTAAAGSEEYITGTAGNVEVVDPRYKVEPSWRFEPGAVFKILWSEPLGQAKPLQAFSEVAQDETKRFYIGYRRFIIVATDEGHSTCVPILTYERKGCRKKGVHASKHGIVYIKGTKPRLLKDEPKLGYDPVAVEMSVSAEGLARESRVNYSKLVTIEHNVKVFFIGRIDPEFFPICTYAVNDSWEKKWTQPSKKHRK